MQKTSVFLFFLMSAFWSQAQLTSGTTGLLNIPTADMQEDGTFMAGANLLPERFTPAAFSYSTGNYFFNITFLPFFDVTYRLTLFKSNLSGGKYSEQDRSFGMRLRLWQEKKYLPAVVIGGNDIYTSVAGNRNQYFGSLYAVSTKTFQRNETRIKISLGAGINAFNKGQMDGLFLGVKYSPGIIKQLSLMADYDTRSFNIGGSVLLFKHFFIHAFLNDFNDFVAGGAVCFKI